MAYLPPSKVKQGFWINWSHGRILGSTITVDTTTANVVVAVLAVVVSLASLHLWHILLFSFYQIRSKNKRVGDGLYRQQQALLRSLASPEQTLWDFGKLSWMWRSKARNSFLRSFGLMLAALFFAIGALAAGLTSSFIVSTSTIPVLVDSDNCGQLSQTRPLQEQAYSVQSLSSSLDYARNCYTHDISSGSCIGYVKPTIDFTIASAPCPFETALCTSSGIAFDTGYMDSNNDFGINAIPEDRIQVRKKTACAPVQVSGYYNTINATNLDQQLDRKPFTGEQVFELDYGIIPDRQAAYSHYLYDTYASNFTNTYLVKSQKSGPSYGTYYRTYIPIKELRRNDADTALVWVFSNAVQYADPVNDPVFSAHNKGFVVIEQDGAREKLPTYKPDYPLGAVACAEQWQVCNTNKTGSHCTELGGLPRPKSPLLDPLNLNENQHATFRSFFQGMLGGDVSLAGYTATPPLRAIDTLSGGLQAYLPANQWEDEVKLWQSLALASIQNIITARAIGTGLKGANGSEVQFDPPHTPAGKRLCKQQKMMLRGGFANISVFGLAFTVAISGVVIFIDLLLLKILAFLGKFSGFWGFNLERWVQDGALQLQRKAYEGVGQGTWTLRDKEIPLVGADDQLYDFDLEDQKSEGPRSNSSTGEIVILDSHQLLSTPMEQPKQSGDTEIKTPPMDSVNATSTASMGSEAGAEATIPTNAETIFVNDEATTHSNFSFSPLEGGVGEV